MLVVQPKLNNCCQLEPAKCIGISAETLKIADARDVFELSVQQIIPKEWLNSVDPVVFIKLAI